MPTKAQKAEWAAINAARFVDRISKLRLEDFGMPQKAHYRVMGVMEDARAQLSDIVRVMDTNHVEALIKEDFMKSDMKLEDGSPSGCDITKAVFGELTCDSHEPSDICAAVVRQAQFLGALLELLHAQKIIADDGVLSLLHEHESLDTTLAFHERLNGPR